MPPYCPPSTHYCEVNAYPCQSANLKIIGPGGHNFKRITKKLGIQYLWWNIQRNVFEIWGPYEKMNSSSNYLIKYMDRFYDKHCKYETQIDVITDQRPSKRSKIF